MQETTIDFGIDLGTTNSAIAVMNKGQVEIIKNRNFEITPSVVYMNKKGRCTVGHSAKNRLTDAKSTSDVQLEFKRTMGQRVNLKFESASTSRTPAELSAEVVKELSQAAEGRYGQKIRAAIITIPAMFEESQRRATAHAGKLAGLEHCHLLAEPVAAAVAYGFRTDVEKAFWLVYDFGGGTFDASIVSLRDGQLSVVEHAGDNYLGGSDFDWLIVEHVLVSSLQEQYDLPNLNRQSMKNDPFLATKMYKLKGIAEQMKIDLSRSEVIDPDQYDIFEDDSGKMVELEGITLTRGRFDELIQDMVDRSVQVVRKLLKDAKLKPRDIQKLLLVGGSTFIPLVRDRIETLGIPVEYELDPMTVVAQGAAVFAASQKMPEDLGTGERTDGQASISLEYQPVSKETNPLVGGKLTLGGNQPVELGTTLELSRDDSGWSSGSIPLEKGGMFFTNVDIVRHSANSFTISVRDSHGNAMEVVPKNFTITQGLSVAKATLPQSIRLVKYDGSTDLLLEKGTQLPATITNHSIKTAKTLIKGDASEKLHIPFCEGEEGQADRNRIGARIVIKGNDERLTRSLPEGTDLEISATVDESGVLHLRVFVPLIDDEFEAATTDLVHEPPDIMKGRIFAAEQRIVKLEEKAETVDNDAAETRLQSLHRGDRIAEIHDNIAAWEGGDASAAGRARNLQLDIDKELDEIESLVEWPSLLAEYQEKIGRTRALVHDRGGADFQQTLAQLDQEGDQAIQARDPRMLRVVFDRLGTLRANLLAEDPAAWAAWFHQAAEQLHRMNDPAKAQSCLREGQQAIERKDFDTLQSVVHQLFEMLPDEVSGEIQAIRSDVH